MEEANINDKKLLQSEVSSMEQNLANDFWVDGSYKRVCKRIEEGSKLCEDVSKMITERADIEILFANKLKGWKQKWSDHFHKSPEYGTLNKGIEEMFKEADSVYSSHIAFQKKSIETSTKVSEWRSANFHRGLVNLKEAKRSEEAFSKAQKPWIAKQNEVQKCMRGYHQSCHSNDSLSIQMKTPANGTEIAPEVLKKLKDKKGKAELEQKNNLDKYKDSVRDLNSYKQKYEEDMKFEFERCQKAEEERKIFIRQILMEFMAGLDRTIFTSQFERTQTDLKSSLERIDPKNDVAEYSRSYGPTTTPQPAEFQEYDPALHASLFEKGGKVMIPQQIPQQRNVADYIATPVNKKSSVCTTL